MASDFEGLFPYTKRYLGTFENHFSTIGLIGMNEVGLNAKWLGEDMTSKKTQAFSKDVLNHMRERLGDYQELYGDLYNLEATPAESTAYRLAKHDVEMYPDIKTAARPGETPYYTNSSHLPVGYTDDVFAALDIQDELQTLYTSGTVFHAFLGEKMSDWKSTAALVRKIAENYKLPYYTISPTYSICREHGYLNGEQYTCPSCGNSTEVYSRITGYYRPVQNWNNGKAQEFRDRVVYDISRSGQHVMKEKKAETCACRTTQVSPVTVPVLEKAENARLLLVTTKTCPNCKAAEGMLQRAGILYDTMPAEENRELVENLKIRQAPTLVRMHGEEADVYIGTANIRDFIARNQ